VVKSLERLHRYLYCPRCKADVDGHHRFCHTCTYWLTDPGRDDLRGLDGGQRGDGRLLGLGANFFQIIQSSYHLILAGLILSVGAALLAVVYANNLFPSWMNLGPQAQRRGCYSNMRVIQGAIEAYMLDHPFSRALASDPVDVLQKSEFLWNRPKCSIDGNRYRIPRGSSLQCVGSQGHGLP